MFNSFNHQTQSHLRWCWQAHTAMACEVEVRKTNYRMYRNESSPGILRWYTIKSVQNLYSSVLCVRLLKLANVNREAQWALGPLFWDQFIASWHRFKITETCTGNAPLLKFSTPDHDPRYQIKSKVNQQLFSWTTSARTVRSNSICFGTFHRLTMIRVVSIFTYGFGVQISIAILDWIAESTLVRYTLVHSCLLSITNV